MNEPPPDTIAGVMASAVRVGADGRGRVNAPRVLASWPGIVHGGGAVALLDAAAHALGGAEGPRVLEGRLTSSLPLETELALEAHGDDGAMALTVVQAGQTLTSGVIRALDGGGSTAARWRSGGGGLALPMSEDCLACGAGNPLGLRVALRFDDEGVWARLVPGAAWRAAGGRLHPGLAPVLLDEVAWWLGALVAKEGGLTNRISLTLFAPDAPWGEPLVAAGRFADVAPVDRKRTFWRTESALMTEAGALLASASIVFRGGAEYSARQMEFFRRRTPPDVFRRMFPNHAR